MTNTTIELITLLANEKISKKKLKKLWDGTVFYPNLPSAIADFKEFLRDQVLKSVDEPLLKLDLATISNQDVLELLKQWAFLIQIEDGYIITSTEMKRYQVRLIASGAGFATPESEDGSFSDEKNDNNIYIPEFVVSNYNLVDKKVYFSNIKEEKDQSNHINFDNVFFFSIKLTDELMVVQVTDQPQPMAFIPQGPDYYPVLIKIADGIEIKKSCMGVVRYVCHTDYRGNVKSSYTLEKLFDSPDPVKNTIDSILFNFNLRNNFPDDVVAQAQSYGEEVPDYDHSKRKDLTHLNFVTIDGEDARDFDDAVYIEKQKDGWKLYVAIADVSYYVRDHDALDQEARLRTTSIYFPTKVIPMLPEELSNGLCSLNPHVKRYALCCEMDLDEQGQLLKYDFYEACIISKKRFTYNQVQAIIDNDFAPSPYATPELVELVKDCHQFYQVLADAKEKRGAVNLEISEAKFAFNPDGSIKKIFFPVRKDAHKLIEEFMVITNVAAARFVEDHATVAPHRNHEAPSEVKVNALNNYLAYHNLSVPLYPSTQDYVELAKKVAELPDRDIISSRIVQSFSRAEYSPESNGHFGLALDKYAQFTSPIRRYPDLLLHRSIKNIIFSKDQEALAEEGGHLYNFNKMQELCTHCSEMEQNVEKAYFEFLDWIKAVYMERYIGHTFRAVISYITKSGAFVTIPELQITGFLNMNNSKAYGDLVLGSTIEVIVQDVNVLHKKINFTLKSEVNTKGGFSHNQDKKKKSDRRGKRRSR